MKQSKQSQIHSLESLNFNGQSKFNHSIHNQQIFNLKFFPEKILLEKKQLDYIRIIKGIKLQDDLRKIRKFKDLQRSIKKEKNQISQIQQELEKVEQKIVQKKKQLIQKHLQQIAQNKHQRQQFNQLSNKKIQIIKQKNEEKNKNVSLIVKSIEQKELDKHQKTLNQRVNRCRNPLNFDQIKKHQKKYLQLKQEVGLHKSKLNENPLKKRSLRVKSEVSSRYENQFQHLSIDRKSRLDQRVRDEYNQVKQKSRKKRIEMMKLLAKRNQYGNRMQFEKKNVRVKTQNHEQTKRQKQARLFLQKIKQQNQQQIHTRKPKLDTNLPKVSSGGYARLSFKRIIQNSSTSLLDKMQKVKALQNFYLSKSSPEAQELIGELSLIKADLYLKL